MRALALALLAAALAAPLALASGAAPAPQALAFSDGDGNVYLGTVTGASPKTVASAGDTSTLTPLSVAPNGSQLLVYEATGDTDQLATLPVAGGAPAPVDGTQGSTDGSFSPDGRSIVFSLAPEVSTLAGGIYTVPVGGGTPTRVVATPKGAVDSLPAISPDGKTVAFVRETTSGGFVDTLELAPLAGGRVNGIAIGAAPDVSSGGRVSFSPDGTRIAYAGSFDTPGIFSVPVDGGKAKRLTSGYDSWPSYTANGASIVFGRDATSANADDNAAKPAAPVSASANDVSELWTMAANGSGAAVVAEGDWENLATAPYHQLPLGPAKSVRVHRKAARYTVTWKGTAPAWQVTLTVGSRAATARVKGSVHRRVFTIRGAKGTPHAAVTGIASVKVKVP